MKSISKRKFAYNMRCPKLNELPSPPPGKTGWPWTEESPQSPNCMKDGSQWPKISIITPSYNQGKFIEETIRSVLLQGYPDLEYIVMDGGSTDNSKDIIKMYSKWITYWESEPDNGQSDAINKGLARVQGEWTNWINSDDLLAPGALAAVGEKGKSLESCAIIAGDVINFNSDTGEIAKTVRMQGINFNDVVRFWRKSCVWHQPGLFFPKMALDQVGYLDTSLHYAMDHDLLVRLMLVCQISYINTSLAYFRLHNNSKGVSQPIKTTIEKIIIARKYWSLTKIPLWINELQLNIWLIKAVGSIIKRRNWQDLQLILRFLINNSTFAGAKRM